MRLHLKGAGALLALLAVPALAEDATGCKDHPLFNRLTSLRVAKAGNSTSSASRSARLPTARA
jgi:hypothetical protein